MSGGKIGSKVSDRQLTAGVAVCAAVATFHGGYTAAQLGGVWVPISFLYPIMSDGLGVLGWRKTRTTDGGARLFAWLVVVLGAGMSGTAQAAALAYTLKGDETMPGWYRAGMGAAPALFALLAMILHALPNLDERPAAAPPQTTTTETTTTETPAETPAETPPAAVDPEPERVPAAAELDAMFRLPAGTVETIRERAAAERADAARVLAAQRVAVLDRVPAVVPAPAPAPEGAPAPTDEGAPAPAPEGAPAPRPRRHRAGTGTGTRGGTHPGTRTDVPAKVRRHWERERGAGRTPTGPELARIAGVGETRGKQYRRALEAEGAGTVTPIGAARA